MGSFHVSIGSEAWGLLDDMVTDLETERIFYNPPQFRATLPSGRDAAQHKGMVTVNPELPSQEAGPNGCR